MTTAQDPPPFHSDDPLLAQEAYAAGWWGGFSSRQWRIVDKDGRDVITAARARDPVRSLLWACMGIVAIFGAGGGLLLATLGNSALVVGGITMLVCLAAVLLLAPVVALRRPRPVMVRDAESGAPLLEIHRRTRVALAYHVQLPGGQRLAP